MRVLRLGSRQLAWLVYAAATFFSFPHERPDGGSIDLGWLLAWVGPAALVVAIEGASPRRAARAAGLAGLLTHAAIYHWLYIVTVVYGGMPAFLGPLAPLSIGLYASLFTAAFGGIWAKLSPGWGPGARVALGAALWVSLDWLRSHFLSGFPWASLGYALHGDLLLLPLTAWTGVYLLSFVASAGGIALAGVWLARDRAAGRALAVTAVLVAALHGLGAAISEPVPSERERIRMAAIQGNIDQGEKWDAERRERILSTYLRLSRQAADQGARWIVWPETAIPGLLEIDPELTVEIRELARETGAVLVLGGMGVAPDESGTRIGAFYDSAFLFDPEGRLLDRYDKTHLVPFGEYVPLRAWLGRFFEALASGLASSDVSAGVAPRALSMPMPEGAGRGPRVGVPICYELLFPHLVRHFGAAGAEVLLAITNDAWYGRTGAPHQFLAMSALRAAENGRWMLRAANTGISAVIDSRGVVREAGPLFEEAIVIADVPIAGPGRAPTFYAAHGDVFAWLCVVSVVVVFGVARRRVGTETGAVEPPEGEDRDR